MKRLVFILLFSSIAWGQQTGPNFPTTATGNTNAIGGGVGAWVNPTNIEAADGVFSTTNIANSSTTDDLIGEGYGFAIPGGAPINGILLEINVKSTNAIQNGFHNVRLLKAGTAAGNDKAPGTDCNCTSATTFSFGGSTDLWGTTWTASDINNSTFGSDMSFSSGPSGSSGISVDYHRITVFFTGGASQMLKMFAQTSTPGGKPVTIELPGLELQDALFKVEDDTMKYVHGHEAKETIDSHPCLTGDFREVFNMDIFNAKPATDSEGRRTHAGLGLPAYSPVALCQSRSAINQQVDWMPIKFGFDVDCVTLWSGVKLGGERLALCGKRRERKKQQYCS